MSFFPPGVRFAVAGMQKPALSRVAAALLCCAVSVPASAAAVPHKVGPGKVLTTNDGQEIYGFDIDQNGKDGVLATAGYQGNTFVVSVETFDQVKGTITKSFATRNSAKNSYSVDGIFSGDAGLVTQIGRAHV